MFLPESTLYLQKTEFCSDSGSKNACEEQGCVT